MATSATMREQTLQLDGRAVRVHVGGQTDPGAEVVVLLHGEWGSASLHWAPIWDGLAQRFRVVAPELPGFGQGSDGGPVSVPEFATWTSGLMTALGVDRAWLVGSAFGGAIGWQLATVARARVRGLVLLNGGPPPPQPWLIRKFFARGGLLARGFVRHALRNGLFGPLALARGFADPSRAPEEVRALIAQPDPPQLRLLLAATIRGGATEDEPRIPVMMLWGESDRLPGTDSCAMDRLVDTGNPPRFETLPGAGHVPQLERPAEVLERILSFVVPPAAT
jgi:2-hydroxy-6-oxonona-2,4-dienedioate hydrolase